MEQHEYFALALKARHDRVPILADDGIIPTSFLETGLRVRGEPAWSATATRTARRSCSKCTGAWTVDREEKELIALAPCPTCAPTSDGVKNSRCPSSDSDCCL
jgi:hypothetical protein